MSTLFRQAHQFLRYVIRPKSRDAKRAKVKDALPPKAAEKIKMWKRMLEIEIRATLSTKASLSKRASLKNLSFESFTVDPNVGNLITLRPDPKQRPEMISPFLREGAWVDLRANNQESFSAVLLRVDSDIVQVRTREIPPPSLYNNTEIAISLSEDRYILDFLLEFWDSDNWRTSPGHKNFLRAHHALPITAGRNRSKISFINKNLNESQKHAIELAMHPLQTLLSIQGPPGTGKTDVIAEIILQNFRKGKNVLVLAPSNAAVDNVAERVYRLMDSNRAHYRLAMNDDPKTTPFAIRDAVNNHEKFYILQMACERGTQFWENEQLGPSQIKNATRIHDSIYADIVGNAKVIYNTLLASSVRALKHQNFQPDLVIIDEAAQAIEVLAWYAIMQANRAIVVGDQYQLGSVFYSPDAQNSELSTSVMEYLEKEFGSKIQIRLQTQYRANEKIMKWSNDLFYGGELQADDSVRDIRLEDIAVPEGRCYTEPLVMVDTRDAGHLFHEVPVQTSFKNPGEAQVIEAHVRALLESGLDSSQIGIITPYRSQANLIGELMGDVPNLQINSVDGFQGREREVICMSLVRSRRNNIELGFLKEIRRMNVSITRAKRQFFLVANSATLEEHEDLQKLLRVIEENGRLVKAAAEWKRNRAHHRKKPSSAATSRRN